MNICDEGSNIVLNILSMCFKEKLAYQGAMLLNITISRVVDW